MASPIQQYAEYATYAQCDGTTATRTVVDTLNADPTEYAFYDPASLTYYTTEVWPDMAPSIVALCLYVAVFLFWIVWRSVLACRCCCWCSWCCRCCRRSGKAGVVEDGSWGQVMVYEASKDGGMVPVVQSAREGMSSNTASSVPPAFSIKSTSMKPMSMSAPSKMIATSLGGQKSGSTSGEAVTSRKAGRWELVMLTGAIVMGLGVIGSSIYGMTSVQRPIVTNGVEVINTSGRGYVERVLTGVQVCCCSC